MMKIVKRKHALLQSVAILLAVGVPSVASAQVEEIVVTAQKREQSIRDVPISLAVISGDDLKKRQVSGIQDLANSVPNVFVSKGTVSDNIYIRGVGSGSNAGFEQAVATFVDGIYHGRSRYTQSALVDLERVEVLRGPQTIYFGNNAIGGAFSVTTKKPSLKDWGGYALASYEFEGNEPAVEAAVGGPIVEDKLAVRIAGRYSHLGGYIKNDSTGKDNPKIKDRFIRGSALWQMAPGWTTLVKAEYGKQDSIAPFAAQLTDCPPAAPFSTAATFSCAYALATNQESKFDYHRQSEPGEFGNIKASEYMVKIERENIDGPGLVAQASYSKMDFQIVADTDGVPASFFNYNSSEYLKQSTVELRIVSPAQSKIEYVAGVYYLHSKAGIGTTLNFPFANVLLAGPLAPLAPFAPLAGDIDLREKENAFSAFGSVTYPLTDKFSITGALRYTHSKKTGTQSATNAQALDTYGLSVVPLPAGLQPVAAFLTGFVDHTTQARVSDGVFLPSVSAQYKANRDVSFYAKYSKGFKAGGFDAVELTGIPDRLSYAPEKVNAFEAGLKSVLFDRSVSFNLSVFRSMYKDLQQSVTQFTATSAFITVTNVGGLRTQGVEAELVWRPNDRFEFGSDFALLDASYRNYANAGCTALQALQAKAAGKIGCSQDLSGRSPPFAPKYTGNVRAAFNQPLNDALKFSANAMLSFAGSYDVSPDKDPVTRQKSWRKIDLRLGIGDIDDKWTLAFVGTNLANVKVSGSATGVVASAGSFTRTILRGRTLAAQAQVKF
ncbi:TonB-dependent receptor [Rhizorhabdus wittichii]|uniref:TonB-dependent receptor n=1 Tax=Rhizorhabdus wittichii TaxID=160791 RepID=UPI000364073B|nr:TonB-dependent receptor [Rhizorhabdus wittichii]